jgi:thiol-disulfide isomerase/thioredoxin
MQVLEVFGKTKTFTIIEVENGQIRNVHVIDNPTASYEYDSGSVAVKTLTDLKIDRVLALELGPGASRLFWCVPCLMIAPIIEDLARQYVRKVLFGKLSVDEYPLGAIQYGIMGIPILVFFKMVSL